MTTPTMSRPRRDPSTGRFLPDPLAARDVVVRALGPGRFMVHEQGKAVLIVPMQSPPASIAGSLAGYFTDWACEVVPS